MHTLRAELIITTQNSEHVGVRLDWSCPGNVMMVALLMMQRTMLLTTIKSRHTDMMRQHYKAQRPTIN